MSEESKLIKNWIKLGIICGLLSSIIYPSLLFISVPLPFQVSLIMAWGPLLGLSAVGLYYFLALNKKTVSLKIAVTSQIISGVLVTMMLIVQFAVKLSKPDIIDSGSLWAWNSLNHVQLGIDVVWDLFISLSTLLFAINMYNHPKFGKLFSITGSLIAIALICLNILSFPTPPAEVDSFDFGPILGLWGLAVTVVILIKYKWAESKLCAV